VVVFLLDEFDQFARKAKQSLLYNLLDALQSSEMQVNPSLPFPGHHLFLVLQFARKAYQSLLYKLLDPLQSSEKQVKLSLISVRKRLLLVISASSDTSSWHVTTVVGRDGNVVYVIA
jgi:hypothetical protein